MRWELLEVERGVDRGKDVPERGARDGVAEVLHDHGRRHRMTKSQNETASLAAQFAHSVGDEYVGLW